MGEAITNYKTQMTNYKSREVRKNEEGVCGGWEESIEKLPLGERRRRKRKGRDETKVSQDMINEILED